MLLLESFQAGLSWECILNKRDHFKEAFDNFDYNKISKYRDDKINELLENKKIISYIDSLSIPYDNMDLSKTTDFGTSVKSVESVVVVSQRKTKRYLQFDDDMRLIGWKNIETGEVKGREGRPLAFSGIHIFHPSLAPLMEDWPDRFPIMDFYLKVCADHVIRGFEAPNLKLLDVGKLDTLEQANIFIETNMNNVNNIIHE